MSPLNTNGNYSARLWFWWVADGDKVPSIYCDRRKNNFGSWLINEIGDAPGIIEPVYFKSDKDSAKKILSYKIIYTSVADILAREEGVDLFRELPESEVSIYKATVACPDGDVDGFYIIRPRVLCDGMDFSASDVQWTRENEFYVRWRKVEFISGAWVMAILPETSIPKKLLFLTG